MLIVIGTVHVDPSDAVRFASEIEALAKTTRTRAGCLFYAGALEDAAAGRMLVAERWTDQAALTAHLEAPDVRAFVQRWATRMRGDVLKFDGANERSLTD